MTRQNTNQRFSSSSANTTTPTPSGTTGGFSSHSNPVSVPRPRSQQNTNSSAAAVTTTTTPISSTEHPTPKTSTPYPNSKKASTANPAPRSNSSNISTVGFANWSAIAQQQQHVLPLPLSQSLAPRAAAAAPSPFPQQPLVSKSIANCYPYGNVVCPTRQMVPSSLSHKMGASSSSTTGNHHHHQQQASSSIHPNLVAKECLENSAITFHFWEEIEENSHYECEILGRPSRLQPMEALEELRKEEAKMNGITLQQQKDSNPLYGLHMGQFLRQEARIANFEALNFLTIQLLADIADVTLYKCDFDKTSCCRVFLDGPQSYERVLYWNKRLRSTPQGVFVAHDERAASLLEDVNLDKMAPYHTIPITALKTSYEQTARQRGGASSRFTNSVTPPLSSTTYGGSFATPPVLPQMVTPSLGACTPPPQDTATHAFRSAAKELELPAVLDLGASCADSNGNTPTPAATVPSSTTASNPPGLLQEIVPATTGRLTPNSKKPQQEDPEDLMMSGSGYASDQETPMKVTRSSCSIGGSNPASF